MLTPQVLPNEAERVAAVRRYDLLDTLPEEEFDDLTQLASHICDTPIALMTILDGQRQWFKSRVGLAATQTPQDISFCGHAILGEGLFEVPNALTDARFHDNPLVTGNPDIRFYAGAPLVSHDGFRLGTLCVIDTVPRTLTAAQRASLAALGRQVCRQVEARATVRMVREQSQFKDAVLDSSQVGIVTLSLDGAITGFNRGAESLFGHPAPDVLGKSMPPMLWEPRAHAAASVVDHATLIKQASLGGAAYAEWRVSQPAGGTVPVEATVSAIVDAGGVARGYLCMLRDVSQRKQAELALHENQRFLTTLIDTLPVAVHSTCMAGERAGQLVLCNHASERIIGMRADAVIGKTIGQIFPDERAALYEAHNREIQRTGTPIEIPFHKVQRADGSIRVIRTVSVPMLDDVGTVEFILGISEDVTAQTRQNRELKKKQAELQAVSDASPLGLFRTDVHNNCTYVNRKYEEITGLSAATAAGQGWITALLPEERSRVLGARAQAAARMTGFTNFQRYQRADGSRVLCKVMAAPVMVDGQFTGFVGTVDDVTDRKRVSDELAASQDRLRLITDNLPALVGYIDAQQCYRFANSAYRRLLNLDPEAMIGTTVRQTYGDQAYARMEPEIAAALRGERVIFERMARKGDRQIHFQCDYVPDLDDYGQVRGFYAMAVDVTARHVAEKKLSDSESRLRAITDNIPALVAHIDAEQRYLFVNAQIGQTFGKDPASLIGTTMQQQHPPELYRYIEPFVLKALAGNVVTFEGKTVIGGGVRHYQSTYVPFKDASGAVGGFYAMTFDITESKINELAREAGERRLRTITDNLPVLITYIDDARRFAFANATIAQWMGVTAEAVLGKPFEDVVGEAIYAQRKPFMDRALAGERVEFEMTSEAVGIRRHMHAAYIPDLGPEGAVKGFYTLTTDITTIKESEHRLDQLARSDFLTGLPNRFELNTKIGEAMARSKRSKDSIALMFLDIDHFKTINDTHGHAIGDQVLIEFAKRLKQCVRETDTVGRLAGDEFVILLEGLHSVEEPQVVARKILQSLALPMQCEAITLSVQTSIGIGYAHTANLTPEQLLDIADKSLYKAKSAGRNTFKTEQAA